MPRRSAILVVLLLAAPAVAATATLQTSAYVRIVPGVAIERVPPPVRATAADGDRDALVFRISGPPDRAVSVSWKSDRPRTDDRRFDGEGDVIVRLDEGAADGHLLVVYE